MAAKPTDTFRAESRALVPLRDRAVPVACWRQRTNAPFIAQLAATRDGAPQTTARRRADPQSAAAIYLKRPPVACANTVDLRIR